ncbi:VWA domain-containing protein [Streptomyces sp. SMS_SU21]|nr:VWA domain-containing protein [Streptomyces sp. SMS_SU21]
MRWRTRTRRWRPWRRRCPTGAAGPGWVSCWRSSWTAGGGTARGAIVVVLSDGWERGDPELLAERMRRLHRLAHRVIWANPLKARPGHAPLAAGMAAALPSVDAFVEAHGLAAPERLAEVVRGGRPPEGTPREGAEGA